MVHVSAADEPDAGLHTAQFRQQFAPPQSDGIHPDTVQQNRWMVHEQSTADVRAGLQLRADPFNLLGINLTGHGSRDVGVNPEAQPAGG
ncbi:hypothetical protein LBMAG46_09230 [Planctomycetia bacterium]|nr:hypothetical protein LBMAG46_09230 [Planctomycetia bacterium]